MLVIERRQRRKNPGGIAPGSQQRWIKCWTARLLFICLFVQPALDINAAFITAFPGRFGLHVSAGPGRGTLAHTRLYLYERYRLFFGIIFQKTLQSISSFEWINTSFSLHHIFWFSVSGSSLPPFLNICKPGE